MPPIALRVLYARFHLNFSLKLKKALPHNAGMRRSSSHAAREWSSRSLCQRNSQPLSLSLYGISCATLSVFAFTALIISLFICFVNRQISAFYKKEKRTLAKLLVL